MRRQELHPRTAMINKAQKNQSKKARNNALLWLAATFPQLFDNSLCIRPLKIGIMEDILAYTEQAEAVGISKSKLRQAVVLFTRRIDYLSCLKAREMRIDIHGNPVAMVTEEEAEKAATKIKKRVEKSARNARKNLNERLGKTPRTNSSFLHPSSTPSTFPQENLNPYPERNPAFSIHNAVAQPRSIASVTVKHKSSRQYDPEIVARLKEKLGIARKTEKTEDLVED